MDFDTPLPGKILHRYGSELTSRDSMSLPHDVQVASQGYPIEEIEEARTEWYFCPGWSNT